MPNAYTEEKKVSSTSCVGMSTRRRINKLELYLSPCIKTNSTWIKNPKLETLKLIEGNIGNILYDTGMGKDRLSKK